MLRGVFSIAISEGVWVRKSIYPNEIANLFRSLHVVAG